MLLFIDPNGGTDYDMVVCLTSVGTSISVQPVDASSACGPDKSPGALEISYSFEGQHLQDPDSGKISGTNLRLLLNAEQTIGWKLSPETPVEGDEIQEGTGFISELSSTYAFDSVGTFTGSIMPYGTPTITVYGGGGGGGVVIGGKTWMANNLSVITYANGDPIPQVSDPTAWAGLTTGAWCYYNNDPSTEAVYGRLYNWFAFADIRGLAPTGWNLPTEADWISLDSATGFNTGVLKETGISHWLSPNTGATNSTGFTCVPGGVRNPDGSFGGTYLNLGEVSDFWVAGSSGGTDARSEAIYYDDTTMYYNLHNQKAGLSVRCWQ